MSAQAVGKFAAQKLLRKQMKDYKGKKVETGDVGVFPPLLTTYVSCLIQADDNNRTPTSLSSKTHGVQANSKR